MVHTAMFYYNHNGYEIRSSTVVFGFSQVIFIERTTVLRSYHIYITKTMATRFS